MSMRKGNIRLLYLYWFFHHLIFAYVIERLYWLEHGISIEQTVWLEILYAAVVMAMEIPTGALADAWSRKWLMVASAACALAEFTILSFVRDLWPFALAIGIAGVGKALASGTANALLYDSLAAVGSAGDFEKMLGRIITVERTALAIASLAGGAIAAFFGLTAAYWFSLPSLVAALLITLTLREPARITMGEKTAYARCITSAAAFLRHAPSVRFILLFGIVTSAVLVYLDEFWQVYLMRVGLPIPWFGPYGVTFSLLASLAGLAASGLRSRFGYGSVFTAVVLGFGGCLTAAGVLKSVTGSGFLLLAYFCAALAEPLVYGYLHHRVASVHRATVESFQALALRLASAVTGLCFAWAAERWSMFTAYRLLGVGLLGYGGYFILAKRKYLFVPFHK